MSQRRRNSAANIAVVAAVIAAHLFAADAARGQAIGLPGQSREIPIEINADDGIEWQRDARAYIARGNARAVQGDVAIHAETLIAYYRDQWRSPWLHHLANNQWVQNLFLHQRSILDEPAARTFLPR